MKLLEHQGKQLLSEVGIRTPAGMVVTDAAAAADVAAGLGGRVVLKSQVPSGKRGKAGGIAFADDGAAAATEAGRLLGAHIGGSAVRELLVEQSVPIERELYLAVLNDPTSKSPLVLFGATGGMDIEEAEASQPGSVRRLRLDLRTGLRSEQAVALVGDAGFDPAVCDELAETLLRMYRLYRDLDAELVEVNPLVLTTTGEVIALDSKVSLDPGGLARHPEVRDRFADQTTDGTDLERRGRELGLTFIELDGDVGVLANGAGLTMTTLDAVHHYGGRPANFLEIGGDAYTKAVPALRMVLDNPRVRSLLVNFCGAFARTDVMTGGVIEAVKELRPDIPMFFSIHGTGEREAVRMLGEQLGIAPYELMDDAVRAAVAAANAVSTTHGQAVAR